MGVVFSCSEGWVGPENPANRTIFPVASGKFRTDSAPSGPETRGTGVGGHGGQFLLRTKPLWRESRIHDCGRLRRESWANTYMFLLSTEGKSSMFFGEGRHT